MDHVSVTTLRTIYTTRNIQMVLVVRTFRKEVWYNPDIIRQINFIKSDVQSIKEMVCTIWHSCIAHSYIEKYLFAKDSYRGYFVHSSTFSRIVALKVPNMHMNLHLDVSFARNIVNFYSFGTLSNVPYCVSCWKSKLTKCCNTGAISGWLLRTSRLIICKLLW